MTANRASGGNPPTFRKDSMLIWLLEFLSGPNKTHREATATKHRPYAVSGVVDILDGFILAFAEAVSTTVAVPPFGLKFFPRELETILP